MNVWSRAAAVAVGVSAASAGAFGQGYVCAEGGGNEQNGDWAPAVFGWMVEKGGFGDVVILGVAGSDFGLAQAFLENGAASATNLAVPAALANDPAVAAQIEAADIVYIRGGDQANYVNFWNGTLTEAAIRAVYDKGGVVGGTSAGCAIMSDVIYDAMVGSLTPRQALTDGEHPFMTFTDDFLNIVPGTLLDTHFTERGRLGRLVVMMANVYEHSGRDVLAIGVDDRTALCVHPDLTAEVRGEGAVTFLHRTPQTKQYIEAGRGAVVTNVAHTQLTEGYVYDLTGRQVIERPDNAVFPPPPPPVVPSYGFGSLNGSLESTKDLGDWEWLDFGDDLALFLGKLQTVNNPSDLMWTVISTNAWASTAFDENRVGGPQYAIEQHPFLLAIIMDTGVQVRTEPPAVLRVNPPTFGGASLLLLNGLSPFSTAQSTYISSPQSVGPRQSVALEGIDLHVISEGMAYDAQVNQPFGVPVIAGDADADGDVDSEDLNAVLGQFGQSGGGLSGDADGDGDVDSADLNVVLGSFGFEF